MLYALTKEIEETFFADNVSAYIALAPCILKPETPYGSYEDYIYTDWQGVKPYPSIFAHDFTVDGYCEVATEYGLCVDYRYWQAEDGVVIYQGQTDTRSLAQFAQNDIEQRF